MTNLIDNQGGNTLSSKLDELLPKSEAIDALVGYFYFSGFREVYEHVSDKQIRVLVGKELDDSSFRLISRLNDYQLDEGLTERIVTSRIAAKERYYSQFADIVNKTDRFDSDRDVAAFRMFLDKIDDGSLQIKKTAKPHHGKFYVISYSSEHANAEGSPGVVIEGSSNLTYSGMSGQGEHNRLLTEAHYYREDMDTFNRIWNDSEVITIADAASAQEFRKELEKRLWIYAKPDPYYMYLRVLNEYFSTEEVESMKTPGQITNGLFTDLQYQVDAINIGIDRLNKFGGVIIADVVGLGKSIIASTIAHNVGVKTVVVCPPHLQEQWNDYRLEFNFNAQVFSTGKVEEAYEKFGGSGEELLIVIDEAHKQRNEDTAAYQALHKLCAGNKVVALTATPFNNDPKDIFAIIKLFDTPGQSTLRTVENLSVEFHMLIDAYKKLRRDIRKNRDGSALEVDKIKKRGQDIAQQLRHMIEPVVIRRSRLDLEEIKSYRDDLDAQGVSFAKVGDPELEEYELGPLTDQYVDTLDLIYHPSDNAGDVYIGARYKPASYIRPGSKIFEELVDKESDESASDLRQRVNQSQTNIAKFMRTLLVRRFESSIAAFESTLAKMLASAEQILDHYEKRGLVPILKKGYMPSAEELEDMDEREIDDLFDKLRGKGLIELPADELDANFARDMRHDIEILQRLMTDWQGQGERFDPKFNKFCDTVTRSLQSEPKRKIIVFTEFADTADYVYSKLRAAGVSRVFKYSAGDASTENKRRIKLNFDAGVADASQEDEYDILIATDAISEGYNLHRAGMIINYDIPYNPTRVIQRIGRINRINKKMFEELYICNFFPTPTGEGETRTKAISTLKMDIIHALMGEDTKVLTGDEELRNYFAKQYRDEESLSETLSWDVPHRNIWKSAQGNKKLMEAVRAIPLRTRIARKETLLDEQIISFARLGSNHVFASSISGESPIKISPEEALKVFRAEPGEKSQDPTGVFDGVYQKVKEHLFRNDTVPAVSSRSRRQESVRKLAFFRDVFSPAADYCSDIIKLIREYDALPEGTLKAIIDMPFDEKDPSTTYDKLREVVPPDYVMSLDRMANRQKEDEELVLLSEEIIHD